MSWTIYLIKINEHKSWRNKFIDNLAKDIKIAYPNSTGYSVRKLKYMAKFATEYTEEQLVQELLAQMPEGICINSVSK